MGLLVRKLPGGNDKSYKKLVKITEFRDKNQTQDIIYEYCSCNRMLA
jgi:hypothetical protein